MIKLDQVLSKIIEDDPRTFFEKKFNKNLILQVVAENNFGDYEDYKRAFFDKKK